MADFALGLTKTAVEGTLSRVKSAIEEEKNIKEKVQNDLDFITGEFEIMQSFLNKERTTTDVVVRTWVRQLRNLAFEVEDCVEFVVHLDNKSGAWWWRVLPSCVAPPRHLDEAAAQIRQLKARVDDLSQRNSRYNHISDSASSDSKAITVVAPATNTTDSAFRALCEVWEATGKWHGVGDLVKLINSDGNDLQVISVWGCTGGGAGDLGTTPIFNKAYSDPEICQEFKCRAWVKLRTPFNPDEFRKTLLTQVRATCQKANIGSHGARMKAPVDMEDDDLVQQLMGEQRYLVILEEVTTMVEWDVIKMYLPDSKNGSRIVVSTKQLQTALCCIEKPYQVSELTRFTNHQPLCAFSNKALRRRSGKGELILQIRCRGVVSVWGTGDIKSTVIYKVYSSIMYKSKQFEGVEFARHSWVDVPVPFDLEVLARRLLLHFRSEDLQVEEIAAVGMMRDPDLTRECCRFLREEDCLVVFNGLQSTHDWNLIKAAFLCEPIRGCMVVIANEESVATHCVDEEDGALNMEKDLEADDPVLRPLIKGCQLYGIGDKSTNSRRGHVLSTRREEARNWYKTCCGLGLPYELRGQLGVTSFWGTAGTGKSTAVRSKYYSLMCFYDSDWELDYEEESQTDARENHMYSWVDVPHPFDLRVFFQLLFLDFHSYDLRAKETAAISLMEGQDPIQWCRKFLREEICLVVIDGLRSTQDWDLIKSALFSNQPNKGSVIVITNEEAVAKHCADKVVMLERRFQLNPTIIKGCRYGRKEASRLFSNRREEARGWTVPTFNLIGCQIKAAYALDDCTRYDTSEGVMSVWGIAGVGKSALVRNVYSHKMLGLPQHLKDENGERIRCSHIGGYKMYSWVDVPHPLNLADLSSRMFLDFHSDNLQAKENTAVDIMEGQDPVQVCRKFLCEERCLVVIDGVQSKDDWDYIKAAFLPETTKSWIIVITNDASVARHCVANNEDRVVNVKGFEADAALSLFKKVSGKELNEEEEEKLSTLIMTKCGGIPKVITILGEYLKPMDYHFYALKEINDAFMVMLETNPEFYNLNGLFHWMRMYFDACPDLLKPCIFYLPVFPVGYNIRRRRLVRRWIAEGYSRDTSRSTAEENGERLFSKLVELSIIQQQESKVLCQVNGFFHEYIISRPMEDNLVFTLEGHCSLNTQHAGQHLTIRSSWDRDEIVFRGIDFSRLRSLTVFGEWKSFMVSDKMSLVRVLDLEDTSGVTNDGLELIVKLLPRLKFLSLRGCKEISLLPDSVGSLRQLQTLDVRKTSIVTLPLAIINLRKMQYIWAGKSVGTVTSLPTADLSPASTQLEGSDNTILEARDQVQTSTTQLEGSDNTIQEARDQVQTSTTQLEGSDNTILEARDQVQTSTTQLEGSDNTILAARDQVQTSTTLLERSNNTILAARDQVQTSTTESRPRSLVSWLSNLLKPCRPDNGGVKVPAGIGNITSLHTLGVVNVNGAGGKAFLKEVKKLTQLRKLGVCGINNEKCKELCSAISGHAHLETIKLYGNGLILPSSIVQFQNLKKGNLELTILTQQDIDDLESLRYKSIIRRLCLKPVDDVALHFGERRTWGPVETFRFPVLEIDCTSSLDVKFGRFFVEAIEVLMVRCSSGSSLRISGLGCLETLKEVWLQGSYGEELKQDLERQISEHRNKDVLKLQETRS